MRPFKLVSTNGRQAGEGFIGATRTISLLCAAILIVFCAALALAGCGSGSGSKHTYAQDVIPGTWEAESLEIGGKPIDLSGDTLSIELNYDYTGTLSTGGEVQDITWDPRGIRDSGGKKVPVNVVIELQKSFTVEGVGVDVDDMVCEYSAENETLSLWNVTWTDKVNGMDAYFELSGTLKKAA